MRIFDKSDNLIESPDLNLGYLGVDQRLAAHHEEVDPVEEKGHWETVAEYPNGGKDVAWVVDIAAVEAKAAWDEYEEIYRYTLYTQEEREKIEAERNKPTVEETLADLRAKIAALTVRQEAQEADSGVIYEALRTGGLTAAPEAGEAWDSAKWYRTEDTVTHEGVGYTCVKTCKGREPGAGSLIAYWKATPTEEPAQVLVWGEIPSGETIPVGQLVSHNGSTWRCIKAHTKSIIRQPSAVQTEYWEEVEA